MNGKVIWFFGNSGAGKTTLAKEMYFNHVECVLYDGDMMRKRWEHEDRPLGFSREDRIENNMRIAKLAKKAAEDGVRVIVATICPYRELRDKITEMIPGITWCEVHSCREHETTEEYPFESGGFIGGLGI